MSSLASSILMASLLSWANRRRHCLFDVAFGFTLSECSINSLGTPGMSAGFHAKMSWLARRKLTSELSYLGSSPVSIRVVLELSPVSRSIALMSTSLIGLTLVAPDFFSGILSSNGDNFLDAAKTCIIEFGS